MSDGIEIESTWHWNCRICPSEDGIIPGAWGTTDTRAEAAAEARDHCRAAGHHEVNLRAVR